MNYQKVIIGNHLYFGRDTNDNYVIQVGTVSVTNGTATVTGVGTTFTGMTAGTKVFVGGRSVSVASVADATHFDMTTVWYGTSGSTLPWSKNVANGIDYNTPPSSEALWLSCGDIEDANIDPTRTETEIYSPDPGHYSLSQILTKFSRLKITFTLQDMSELFFEMLMSAKGPIGSGSSGGPYSPYSATGVINGWFRVTQFDQGDGQNNIMTLWGRAVASATMFNNDVVKGKIVFDALKNPKNSGILSLEN